MPYNEFKSLVEKGIRKKIQPWDVIMFKNLGEDGEGICIVPLELIGYVQPFISLTSYYELYMRSDKRIKIESIVSGIIDTMANLWQYIGENFGRTKQDTEGI